MNILSLSIPEVLLFSPNIYRDDRGFFLETMRKNVMQDLDLPEFVQHNQSRSECGVLRGLHYQLEFPQGKLVRCSRGKVFDVAVDIRKGSPTFGKYVSSILDDIDHKQLWIPPGFAHGFLVLSQIADICYMCTNYYHKDSENGIAWNDPDIAISWPDLPIGYSVNLSIKDNKNLNLSSQLVDKLPSLR